MDQDAASQNAALLRNGLSLRGKEKANRMFIFCKVKKKKKKRAGLQGWESILISWAYGR